MIEFSAKQKEVWHNTIETYHRWNVSTGATRSGKTYLDYWKIPYRIRSAGDEGLILLLGNTKGTLERNILDPMRDIWGSQFVGRVGSNNKVKLFGRECYALGADKINQVSKLQGAGLAYCYGDEVTTWHRDVFSMLQSRLDKPKARFDGTCNPDNPKHWFKQFLDSGKADVWYTQFHIDDNIKGDPEFAANLKREYAGTVYYDRFILGNWVAAEGAIYRLFSENHDKYIKPFNPVSQGFITLGVDFGGNKSATAFTAVWIQNDYSKVHFLEAERHKRELTPNGLNALFVDFVRKVTDKYRIYPTACYADSAEQILIKGLQIAARDTGIRTAIFNSLKKPINDRIQAFLSLMASGRMSIQPECKALIDALDTAVWDSKSTVDKRLDDGSTDIDSLDSAEYSLERYLNALIYARRV